MSASSQISSFLRSTSQRTRSREADYRIPPAPREDGELGTVWMNDDDAYPCRGIVTLTEGWIHVERPQFFDARGQRRVVRAFGDNATKVSFPVNQVAAVTRHPADDGENGVKLHGKLR
jgi:hypothetical protein